MRQKILLVLSSTEGRRIGKTFYDSGTTFEGSYYNDVDSVGTIIWTDGDSFKGELGVKNAGYDTKSYDPLLKR